MKHVLSPLYYGCGIMEYVLDPMYCCCGIIQYFRVGMCPRPTGLGHIQTIKSCMMPYVAII